MYMGNMTFLCFV